MSPNNSGVRKKCQGRKKFVGKKIHMDDNSYLEMGNRVTVNMEDAEGGSTALTFPSLEFRTSDEKGGEVYQLDWQAFAQERKLARGGTKIGVIQSLEVLHWAVLQCMTKT